MKDDLLAALSAWFGGHLGETDNGLAPTMAFWSEGHELDIATLTPTSNGRLVVFLHGLASHDGMWQMDGGSYGDRLESRFGCRSLAVRYNTGLPVDHNGALLAQLLTDYTSRHSVASLVLVGHSMGGLVLRAAGRTGGPWVPLVEHLFYLGTPHEGAPLARLADGVRNLLGALDVTATQVVGDVIASRSPGIQGLAESSEAPWLPNVSHHRWAGQLLNSPTLGDGVVQTRSAAASEDVRIFPGLHHLVLMRSEVIANALEDQVAESWGAAKPEPLVKVTRKTRRRWRGLRRLVHDGVDNGSRFVEKHHRAAVDKPYELLAHLPTYEVSDGVGHVQRAAMTVTYRSIRLVNRVLRRAGDFAEE